MVQNLVQQRSWIAKLLQRRGRFFPQELFGFRGFTLLMKDAGHIGERHYRREESTSEVGAHTAFEQTTNGIELERP
jgi:hypothetical protein